MNDRDEMVNGEAEPPEAEASEADETVTPEERDDQVVSLIDSQHSNRLDHEDWQAELKTTSGRKKTTLTKKIAEADAVYARQWAEIAALAGESVAAKLRELLEEDLAGEDSKGLRQILAEARGERTHCDCGSRLRGREEFAAGFCETCGHDWPDGKLRREEPPEYNSDEYNAIEDAHLEEDHAKVDELVKAWIDAHPATPPAPATAEYPHCACGAVLALDAEQASGVCEACGHLGADGKLYATPEAAAAIPEPDGAAPATVEPVTPSQPSLFPPEPFDLAAAFEDIAKKNRAVEACRHLYEEKKQAAADAKKQWEAAVTHLEQVTSTYDAKYRAWLDAEERQVAAERAYREKLEAEAAKAAAPELPLETEAATDAPPVAVDATEAAVDATVATPDAPTPLSDALPACGLCENKLALDTELAAGICEDCAGKA